jgi:hypothetical protein
MEFGDGEMLKAFQWKPHTLHNIFSLDDNTTNIFYSIKSKVPGHSPLGESDKKIYTMIGWQVVVLW